MSGIIATLITNYKISFFGEKISNLAFTFIPPLRTYQNNCRQGVHLQYLLALLFTN